MTRPTHPLLGKTVRWKHGPNVLVGPATHYEEDDDELFIVPDGLMHGHYWVPAKACTEYVPDPVTDEQRQRLREAAERMDPLSEKPYTSLDLALVRDIAFRAARGENGTPQDPSTAQIAAAAREYHERHNGKGTFDTVPEHVRASRLFRMGCALRAAGRV